MSVHIEVTRREFLRGSGALLIAVSVPGLLEAQSLPRSLRGNPDLDTWLRVDAGGTITVFSGKVELGQGIHTALAQVVADELDVGLGRLRMATVDTSGSPDEGRTVGSNSVPDGAGALRFAAAQARKILVENAAARLGVDARELSVADGVVRANGGGAAVSYWELLSDDGFNAEADGSAAPKPHTEHRYVGSPQPRVDLPAKFCGEPAYIHDVRLPGMAHARVVRGEMAVSEIVSIDDAAVSRMPGVLQVVRDGNFLAVVAEREEQAIAAAEALRRATRWRAPKAYPGPDALPALLRQLPTEDSVISETPPGGAEVVREFQAEYSRPFLAHASLGPSCAIAQWDGSTMTIWSHTQGPYPLRGAIAEVLGLPESRVRCIHADGAGCYGHNGADDVACDAALVARALEGRPVRMLWSRQDEFRYEPYGSAMSLQVSAGVDASDRIVRWRYDLWSCSHSTRPSGGEDAGGVLAAREKADPMPLPPVSDGRQPTGGADRNGVPLYRFPDQRVVEHLVLEPPLRNSALRSLGAYGNVFAIESFMDEIARAVGADPFEFRLRHLEDERGREALMAVRDLAAAAPPASGPGRIGRGVAFAKYKNSSSYVALVVDVSVNPDNGQIRMLRAFAVTDVGQAINPDGVRNQIEGGIVQSASWTLKEQVRFTADRIESVDWASYPILTFVEVPEVEVVLIDRPELPFAGAGEAAQGPTAAAIANAVADATQVRLRHVPFTPDRVLAALRA
ncbi:MAG TPA: molybdopterin cofactor-binding domain-containing protein [Gammaproteobacteria bacterium]|jgi:CO/xanthine dehydrogenase Mo-binding subunit